MYVVCRNLSQENCLAEHKTWLTKLYKAKDSMKPILEKWKTNYLQTKKKCFFFKCKPINFSKASYQLRAIVIEKLMKNMKQFSYQFNSNRLSVSSLFILNHCNLERKTIWNHKINMPKRKSTHTIYFAH